MVIIELLRKWMKAFGTSPQMVVDKLLPLGYELYAISDSKIIKINRIDDSTVETNFIFSHPSSHFHSRLEIFH